MTLVGALNSARVISGPIDFPDPEPVGNCQPPALCTTTCELGVAAGMQKRWGEDPVQG